MSEHREHDHGAEPHSHASEATGAAERDQPLLQVAERVRAARLAKAWERLEGKTA